MAKRLYFFRCPVCCKLLRNDEPGEPLCTGPNEATDDHEPTLMLRVKVARGINPATHYRDVGGDEAMRLAAGPLVFPHADWIDPSIAQAMAGLNTFVLGGPL